MGFSALLVTTAGALQAGDSTVLLPASGAPKSDDDGDSLKNWSSLIGIITAIVGNVLIALALNVQRYAHTRLQKERSYNRQRARQAVQRSQTGRGDGEPGGYGSLGTGDYDGSTVRISRENTTEHDESTPLAGSYHSSDTTTKDDSKCDDCDNEEVAASTYLKSPYWWLGQVLITLGEMGNFLAYGFAPASIVSPLGVVALISNCIIAPAMFKEKFRARDFWGVVIAVGGVVTVVLSAKQQETRLDPDAVWDAITATAFEIYLGVTVGLIIALMWLSPRYGKRTILIDLGLVGLFGGYTALATKGVSSLLSSTLWRAFTTPVTYALLFVLLATAIMQIRYVNKALQRFDSTQVIPIQFVMFTLCVILGSAVLYRDFERTSAEQAGKFVGGCILTFFGVFLITSGRDSSDDEDEDSLSDDEDVEETIGLAPQDDDRPGTRGTVTRSRRSSRVSHVSFASTIKPAITFDHSEVSTSHHESNFKSPSGSLPEESAPLLSQVWSEQERPRTPPRGLRTLSADSVMLLSSAMRTPGTNASPTRNTQSHQMGNQSPTRPGVRTSSKRSGTFISPSPFASTVTAVVKDGFLRPNDGKLFRKSSMHRLRHSIRASLFFNNEDGDDGDDVFGGRARNHIQHTIAGVGEENMDREAVVEFGPASEGDGRGRSRSVSETLGDFFRPRRTKTNDSNAEAGPSEER